jgi:hypothetical protein
MPASRPTSKDKGNQLAQLREFAARQGWAIAVEYMDTVTGSSRKIRPEFERMLLAASQSKVRSTSSSGSGSTEPRGHLAAVENLARAAGAIRRKLEKGSRGAK